MDVMYSYDGGQSLGVGDITANRTINVNDGGLRDFNLINKIYFIFVAVFVLVGLVANLMLLVAIRISPRLKAPIFQLKFALALADIFLLVAYGLPEVGAFLTNGKWALGIAGCQIMIYLQFLAPHITNCLIVVCCWERFYAVCRPRSALWVTTTKMTTIIVLIWLLNAGIVVPLFVMTGPVEIHYRWDSTRANSCALTMNPDFKKLYLTIMGMVFYGITAIVSLAFLLFTICKARQLDPENCFVKDDFKNHILRCVVVLTLLSLFLWLPYRYIYFVSLHKDGAAASPELILFATIFILCSGAIKPILYFGASSQFRKAVFRALKCCKSSEVDYEQTYAYQWKLDRHEFQAESEPL